jgi:hypothetical protein
MEMDEFGDADTEASLDGDRALIMAADARVGGGRVSVKETRRVARHPPRHPNDASGVDVVGA